MVNESGDKVVAGIVPFLHLKFHWQFVPAGWLLDMKYQTCFSQQLATNSLEAVGPLQGNYPLP